MYTINTSIHSVDNKSYRILTCGNPQHEKAICLHGFPDSQWTFEKLLPALADAGFYAIAPTLPGFDKLNHGDYRGHYHLGYVSECLAHLIKSLSDTPVHLIGHDWGALSAHALSATHPQLLKSLTTMTIPSHLSVSGVLTRAPIQLLYSWYIGFFQLPGIAEFVLNRSKNTFVNMLYRLWSPNWTPSQSHINHCNHVFSDAQTVTAMLSYYRSLLRPGSTYNQARELLNQPFTMPCLLLQGRQDRCISQTLWKLIQPHQFEAGLTHEIIDAGHFLHLEEAQKVNSLIIKHLKSHNSRCAINH